MTLHEALLEAMGAILDARKQRSDTIARLRDKTSGKSLDARRNAQRELSELDKAYKVIEAEYNRIEREEELAKAHDLIASNA